MHQRRVGALAEGGGEAIGGQFLAGAGARRLAGQGFLEAIGIDLQILGEAVHEQIAEPHDGRTPGHKTCIIPSGDAKANPVRVISGIS
ncbi:hypothetical protein D3C80_1832500 [compost metagenome]